MSDFIRLNEVTRLARGQPAIFYSMYSILVMGRRGKKPVPNFGRTGRGELGVGQSLSTEGERDLFSGTGLPGSVGKRQIFH